ncbi:NAD(P)H-hydrate dehydratase [Alkalibacter mobilis]|uniref:NAD(P)H-hydrate dehydratase n=1 Tax=Alkalibacter mobilis TaxID=2787712 RepID=UPI00189F46E5|nr:NAD(P)H-hydrate dehydratase [Alkalibacter mobilis]MBF7096507.1 NAD(P)H-hydrate dehydratase [Alkalibacter mobilis]
MNIYTADEMRNIDMHTVKSSDVCMYDLIEKAANAIHHVIENKIPVSKGNYSFLVICGKGNNGADGRKLAELISNKFIPVEILMLFGEEDFDFECDVEKKSISGQIKVHFVENLGTEELISLVKKHEYVIDAITGTGLKGKLIGKVVDVIQIINRFAKNVISIDIPTGVNGTNGLADENSVKAKYTIVVDSYKTGNLLGESCDYSGKMFLTDEIGLNKERAPNNKILLDSLSVGILKPRKLSGHKYTFGKLVIAGGSKGMEGAPIMAALAGLKTGCGLSAILTDKQTFKSLDSSNHELIKMCYDEEKTYEDCLYKASAVVFGPGLVCNDDNISNLKTLLCKDIPMVVDAGGLSVFNEMADKSNLKNKRIIATPHYGEMASLFNVKTHDILMDPLHFVKSFVACYNMDIILKGPCSILAVGGKIWFNYNPNSGMATAGSGDVLAGILGGLLAQGYNNRDSMLLGTRIHNLAGRYAQNSKGSWSMMAGDIIENIHKAIMHMQNNNEIT